MNCVSRTHTWYVKLNEKNYIVLYVYIACCVLLSNVSSFFTIYFVILHQPVIQNWNNLYCEKIHRVHRSYASDRVRKKERIMRQRPWWQWWCKLRRTLSVLLTTFQLCINAHSWSFELFDYSAAHDTDSKCILGRNLIRLSLICIQSKLFKIIIILIKE